MLAEKTGNPKAKIFADTLDQAVGKYLENARYPSRKVNEIDNRGSSFYLALYWAEALAAQENDIDIKNKFIEVAKQLSENEQIIAKELLEAQGTPVDIGGYYMPDDAKAYSALRPSQTLNRIIDSL